MRKIVTFLMSVMILLLCSTYTSAAIQEDFAAIKDEWNREVLADIDKAYTIYVGMSWKDLQTNFARTGWKMKDDELATGTPAIKLTKGFREIIAWGNSSTEIEGFYVIYYTSNRMTAVSMYHAAKKLLEKHYGSLDNYRNGTSYHDYSKLRGYELHMVDNELQHKQYPQMYPKPEFGKQYNVVFLRKLSFPYGYQR